MRILHAIHSANPRGGGPIEGLKQLSIANIGQHHQVELATLDAPGQDWMKAFPLPLYPMGPSISRYGYSPRFVPWLRENHRNYDVVIVNGIWQYNSFAVWRTLKGTKTPYCVFTHGMLDPWFKKAYPIKHLKKWLYWPWGQYPVLRDALGVFFTCEEERRLARQSFWLYQCNEVVLTYGTASSPWQPEEERAAFLEKFPRLAEKRLILFLGRIHEKKGCDLLLEAFARLLGEGMPSETHSLHLVMAGPDDSEYAAGLKKRALKLGIAERISWTGMLSGELKWGVIRMAEAFILPSHQENFGIAVAEALSSGVAVLISNKVNIWREIQEDSGGLVENDDIEGTYRLLKCWFGMSRAEQDAMRENAARCYDHRFSVNKVSASFLNALESLGL